MPKIRDRIFATLAQTGTRRPLHILIPVALVLVLGASLIPGLGVSTSRYGLVADDDPIQKRLVRFFERFGYPDSPLFVIEGGSADERRAVVDVLLKELEQLPPLRGRVLGRIGPREVAEVILMQRPEIVSTFGETLADGRQPADVIEAGLPTIAGSMHAHLNTFALTLQMQSLMPMGGTIGPEQTVEILRGLTGLAIAATKALEGDDIFHRLMQADENPNVKWSGLDELGYLVTSDNEAHIVTMFPDLPSDELSELKPLVEGVRRIRDAALAQVGVKDVRAYLTGVPTLAVDEMEVLQEGIKNSSVVAALAIILLFIFAFRSWRQAILAGAPLLVGVVGSMVVARLVYGELNLVTGSFIPVLMGLAIDFAVHTLARYNEFLRHGVERNEAIKKAIVFAGPAIVTGAFTTAMAFLVTTTTDFTAFSELGVLTAVGLCIALFGTFVVIPPLIASSKIFDVAASPEVIGLRRLPEWIAGAPKTILVLALLASVGAAALLPRLRTNARYFDFLPEDTESAVALERLENDRALSPLFAALSAESMTEARQIAERLRKLPEVGAVQSITDLLPPLTTDLLDNLNTLAKIREPEWDRFASHPTTAEDLLPSVEGMIEVAGRVAFAMQLSGQSPEPAREAEKALRGFRDTLAALPDQGKPVLLRLQQEVTDVGKRTWRTAVNVARRGRYAPEDLPAVMKTRFVSHDQSALAIYAFPNGNIWDQDFADHFQAVLEVVDPEVTGFVITSTHHFKIIISGFKRAAVIVAVLILLLLLLDLRRLSDALLAMVPLGLGWLWMLGVLAGIDMPFNHANIVSLPLIPGIGIAAGVHIIHRCRESGATHGDGVGRLDEILRGTGGAVLVSALTTMAGFAGLLVAEYGAMTTMGTTMVIGVGTCGLSCLVVLPAILVLLGRAK